MSNYYVDPNWCYENPNEAAAELERLHKWCDQLEKESEGYRGQAEKYATERDALAAHVECSLYVATHGGPADVRLLNTVKELRAAPTTSLARLRGEVRRQVAEEWEVGLPRIKAEGQAEALDIFAIHCREKAHQAAEAGHMMQADAVCDVADDANNRAAELRRQAEGEHR